jgi:3',5'-cyclic AMP phosphodiesterase CpdA
MITILHASDLQWGRPYRPAVGTAVQRLAAELEPELVVLAGDLTQRAKKAEFSAVRTYLEGFAGMEVVVTPGNHDVPLYRVWERLLDPYRNWRRYIGPELDTVTRVDGAVCVALSSAAPRRAVVAGHLAAAQVAWARSVFDGADPDDHRILVTHHHFVPTADGEGGRPLPDGAGILRELEAAGVELVLGGHLHQPHLASSRSLVPGEGPGIPLVSSGTAASSRGRGMDRGHNSVNVVRLSAAEVEVRVHRYDPDSDRFRDTSRHVFRRAVGAGGDRAWVGGAT